MPAMALGNVKSRPKTVMAGAAVTRFESAARSTEAPMERSVFRICFIRFNG